MAGSATSDDENERHYYGPYKMTLFDPWDNFGTEAITDLDALYEDLERWKTLIAEGRGSEAAAEIEDVLIAFRNSKSPFQLMCEANSRFAKQEA
jgi:hypothetical protein